MEFMKDCEKIELMRAKIDQVRSELIPHDGHIGEAIRLSLSLLVDYIDFMINPCEDDE